MLPLVDHNQVKMVFASRPQKWGRIGGKEVDVSRFMALWSVDLTISQDFLGFWGLKFVEQILLEML